MPPKRNKRPPTARRLEPWLYGRLAGAGGRIAIDVGANIGTVSAELAPRFAVVYAIEPNPRPLTVLRTSAPANVVCIQAAAGAVDGRVELQQYPDNATPGDRTSQWLQRADCPHGTTGQAFQARQLRIDTLQLISVDLVKIDVEGAEVDVLEGAIDTLQRNRPELIVEVHAQQKGQAVARLLSDLRYSLTRIAHPHLIGRPAEDQHYWLIGAPT